MPQAASNQNQIVNASQKSIVEIQSLSFASCNASAVNSDKHLLPKESLKEITSTAEVDQKQGKKTWTISPFESRANSSSLSSNDMQNLEEPFKEVP